MRAIIRRDALCVTLLTTVVASLGGPAAAATPASDDGWIRGRISLRHDLRTTTGDDAERDQDLTQDLFAEGGRGGALRFEASGRVREDIDGRPEVSVFNDVYDTYGSRAQTFLYTGYGEVLDQGGLERVRLGRQYYAEGIDLRFDGALAETKAVGDAVKLVAYGGSPVHLFESSRRGDWLAGGAIELVAIPRTTVRTDYVHVTDFRPESVSDDDYFQLSIAHFLERRIRLRGLASTFQGKSSRFEGETVLIDPDLGLSGRARYTLQVGAYRDLSIQFTPLDEVLGEYEPYHEVYVDARQRLAEHFTVGGGGAVRELARERDEGPFNHEFQRYFVLGEANDWPWRDLWVSVLGEWYRSDGADRTFQVSADAAQKIGPVTAGAGTGFALYKFDELFLEERERVRSYFGSVEWKPLASLRARVAYTYEVDDEDEYHAVRTDVRITF